VSPPATARHSITVAAWTLVSRLTGLGRVLVLGAVLGPTFFANAAQSGLLLPSLVYTIIAGPLVAMVVIPTVVRVISDRTTVHAADVLGRISGFMLLVAACLTVALVGVSSLVARALTFGVPDGIRPVGVIGFGYRAEDEAATGSGVSRPRRALGEQIHRNGW